MEARHGAVAKPCTTDVSDAELVKQAQEGNAEAWKGLFERHKRKILSVMIRLCRNAAQAEDLTQDVFVKAFQKIDLFRFESEFSTWLYRVAVNIGINFKNRDDDSKGRVDIEVEKTDDGRQSWSIETNAELDEAIQKLPDGERQVLVLHDIEGFTFPQISEQMNLPVAEVKKLCRTAREKLRSQLSR